MFNLTFEKQDDPKVYKDPKYPVHVVTGAAGNRELINTDENPMPEWTAVRVEDYSYR